MRRALGLGAVLLAACTEDVVVTPAIDIPFADPDAEAFGVIDELVISIASEGDAIDLVTKRFSRGDTLQITEVPFGSNLVMHMTGLSGTTQVGYGRTCAFSVSPSTGPVEPHVFFSSSRKFATTDVITTARAGGQAFELEGGVVLLGGGTQEIERFDPLAGELVTSTDLLAPRTGAVGALLGVSPARIALVGGTQNNAPARIVELFDPRDGVDTITDTRMGRQGMTATSLADGRVIVIGGYTPGFSFFSASRARTMLSMLAPACFANG